MSMSIVLSESETESEILWLRTAGIHRSGQEVSAPVIAIWPWHLSTRNGTSTDFLELCSGNPPVGVRPPLRQLLVRLLLLLQLLYTITKSLGQVLVRSPKTS